MFPEGLAEQTGTRAWNVGLNDKGLGYANHTCYPDHTTPTCYESCDSLSECSACAWSTCHSDVAFLEELFTTLHNELCLDMDANFLTGMSNGGMLTYHVLEKLPRCK